MGRPAVCEGSAAGRRVARSARRRRAAAARAGPRSRPAIPRASDSHHHLEGDDLVAGAEEAHRLAVPGGVARAQRAGEVVLLDLLAVARPPTARATPASATRARARSSARAAAPSGLMPRPPGRSIARTRPTRVSAAATSRVSDGVEDDGRSARPARPTRMRTRLRTPTPAVARLRKRNTVAVGSTLPCSSRVDVDGRGQPAEQALAARDMRGIVTARRGRTRGRSRTRWAG